MSSRTARSPNWCWPTRRLPKTVTSSRPKSSNEAPRALPATDAAARGEPVSDPTSLTLAEARDALAARKLSSLELTEAYLAAMEKGRALNAYIAETPDRAREMARASDERIASGASRPLEGLPIGVKDLYATKGAHTQACSHILD